jgi:putative metallohydrolase (TIGR04338 family)
MSTPSDTSIPEGPTMRIYNAEIQAATNHPAPALSGTQEDAQAFVDTVVNTRWWRSHCASWRGVVPRRVPVVATRGRGSCSEVNNEVIEIRLGSVPSHPDFPAGIADPWTILHELAHVMTWVGTPHGREFAAAYLALVHRVLGPVAASALREQYRAHSVKYSARRNVAA